MNIESVTELYLGPAGRLLGSSKGRLSWENPQNLYVFNGNVVAGTEKVWYGDLNLSDSNDIKNLRALALRIGRTVYVLSEMNGRFDNEDEPRIDRFTYKISSEGNTYLGAAVEGYYEKDINGICTLKKQYVKDFDTREEDLIRALPIPFRFAQLDTGVVLPDLNKFADTFPLEAFYGYLSDVLEIPVETLNVSDVIVSKNTAEVLNKLTLDYIRKDCKGDEYTAIKEYSMVSLAYSPVTGQWDGMTDGVAYIRDRSNNEDK